MFVNYTCSYLDGKGVIDERWYPKELHLRARTDEYLAWHHNNTRLTLSLYFWQKWLHPLITGRNPDPKQLAETQKNMETTLDSFENIWLENRKYLTGSEINAADVFAACEILQPSKFNIKNAFSIDWELSKTIYVIFQYL